MIAIMREPHCVRKRYLALIARDLLFPFLHIASMNTDWIRNGLKKPGKSQKGLADALGLDPAAVSRLLNGQRRLKADELEKVTAYLEAEPPRIQVVGRISGTPEEERIARLTRIATEMAALANPPVSPVQMALELQALLQRLQKQ